MKLILIFFFFLSANALGTSGSASKKTSKKASCEGIHGLPQLTKNTAYRDVPFKPGERAIYKISYMGIHGGYGTMDVRDPYFYRGHWNRVFDGLAETGSWYRWIFVAQDRVRAISRAADYGVVWFYLTQDEGAIMQERFIQSKTLDFQDQECKVQVKVDRKGRKPSSESYDLKPHSMDAVSAAYWMRSQDYKIGVKVRGPVFTSENNWWFDVMPLKYETIKTSVGKFKTVKLKLTTYLGKDLQQKGDVYAWVATEHLNKPLIQVQADTKIGSLYMVLDQFTPGKTPSRENLK